MPNLSKRIFLPFADSLPIILLFILVFTGFDLSFFISEMNFSFNFVYILIFFWVLRDPEALGYGIIFLAGIINDVVQNFPIGISSINFLLLCAIAAFVRARTLLPNILYDWIIFFIAIIIVSSINYSVITIVFEIPIKYGTLMASSFLSFLAYPLISKIFDTIHSMNQERRNNEQN
tara:strand:+ start:672 stop:1199 length:528 start_codon:yes stop_codon:yes gene_type:complete